MRVCFFHESIFNEVWSHNASPGMTSEPVCKCELTVLLNARPRLRICNVLIRPFECNLSHPNFFLDILGGGAKMNTPAFHDLNAGVFFSRATHCARHRNSSMAMPTAAPRERRARQFAAQERTRTLQIRPSVCRSGAGDAGAEEDVHDVADVLFGGDAFAGLGRENDQGAKMGRQLLE